MTEVRDSPTSWVAQHIKQYEQSDGTRGHLWRGAPTLLLTTKGRHSGVWHRTALIYGRSGDDIIVVASKGGAPEHPQWYRNLKVNPHVKVQVQADRFDADATTATGEERARLWALMTKVWPDYDAYQTRTSREIPVVVLRRR
jgi:deazaflavin-dependent oxidoreductase (nitroreductase family)